MRNETITQLREFDVSQIRPWLGGLPHLETFTWQNLTPAEMVTRSGRPGGRFGGSPHLSCKDYMDWRVTPPKWVTSPTWGPSPPCKQALRDTNSCFVGKRISLLTPFCTNKNVSLCSTMDMYCDPNDALGHWYSLLRGVLDSRLVNLG